MNTPIRTAEQLVAVACEAERPIPRLIRIDEVCRIIGFKKTTVYKLSTEGIFPMPIKLGTSKRGSVRWVLSEVLDFVENLASKRIQVTPHEDVSPPIIKPVLRPTAPMPPIRKSTIFQRRGRL